MDHNYDYIQETITTTVRLFRLDIKNFTFILLDSKQMDNQVFYDVIKDKENPLNFLLYGYCVGCYCFHRASIVNAKLHIEEECIKFEEDTINCLYLVGEFLLNCF
jgi:hypothetical protein